MSVTLTPTEQHINAIVLHFGTMLKKLSDEEFFEFCQLNKDLRIELTSAGDLIIMPPTGGKTGIRNFELTGNFWPWMKKEGTGLGFDSSTVFSLPNGAKRSPDLAWVRKERWDALTDEERETFPPLCPDFVIELRSRMDSLAVLKSKMEEYIENGAQLGWLIDPTKKKVYVYRPQVSVETLDNPQSVSGEPLLKGFTLELKEIWS